MPQMKESGIEWIGEIPDNWHLERLVWHIEEVRENNNPIKTNNVLSLTNKLGVVPYEDKGAQGNVAKEDYSQYKIAYPNTIVANSMNILIGSVGICNYYGCVSPVYYVYKVKEKTSLEFINYIFQTEQFQKELRKYANGILEIRLRVSSSDILKQTIAIPPYEEQTKVVDEINIKAKQIKSLTDNLNNQIDKLKEYKKALITKCVTKGLDPNVPLKDSGIDWIGEIPESWKISKIKNMYEVVLGKMLCDKPLDDTYTFENYICSQNIKYAGVNQTSVKKMWFNSNEKEQLFLCDGDVLISEGGNAGECCIYHNEFCPCYIQNAVHRVRGINDNLNKFLYYWLYALETLGYFQMICNKATIRHYTREKVLETPIVCLSTNEQKDIVNCLDKKCSEIDALISFKQQQIDKLNEYEKSLTYEYVTGKKEVI